VLISVESIFLGILALSQILTLWFFLRKCKALTFDHQEAQRDSQQKWQQALEEADIQHQQSAALAIELAQMRSQRDALLHEVERLAQEVSGLEHQIHRHKPPSGHVVVSELDHNVGIMIKLWSEHIAQVVDQQAGKGDHISAMLDTVVDDVKLVVSELDITSCVTHLSVLVHDGHTTLVRLLNEQQSGADDKRQSIQELNASVQQINRVEEIVQVMHKLTFTTQLLASNAAVAAARASGEEGRAFKVIAVRMAEFAQEISASAREISRVIGEFKETFDRNLDKTRQQIQADLVLHEQHSQRVAEVMVGLVASVDQANQAGTQLASALVTLESDVAAAVRNAMVGLQYQDRMKQILEHVACSLRDVASRLDTGENLDIESILKQEMRTYTTQEERDLYRRKLAELGFSIAEEAGDEHVLDSGEMMFF